VLSIYSKHYINQDFTIRFKNDWLQLAKAQPTLVLPKAQITIEERLDNTLHLKLNNKYLNYERLTDKPVLTDKPPIALTSNPNPHKQPTTTSPSLNHPWRKFTLLPYNISNRSNQKLPSKKIS